VSNVLGTLLFRLQFPRIVRAPTRSSTLISYTTPVKRIYKILPINLQDFLYNYIVNLNYYEDYQFLHIFILSRISDIDYFQP